MNRQPINLARKLDAFSDHWAPKVIAQMNDYQVKLVKFEGEFVWHAHADTDEVFLVLAGAMTIHFRDQDVSVGSGELFVVPRGVEHKTSATAECHALIIEPAGTINTGDVVDSKTAPNDVWI
jgi:mannose-6-phosphate isomerase-like protein (cupin superfamily)